MGGWVGDERGWDSFGRWVGLRDGLGWGEAGLV